ncbi:hypothetical protein SAMN05216411_104145 [Nitrosospira multiformis]|nr:hypothetical protein SAMN05216411_104145 [Nitrosospira multiformis]
MQVILPILVTASHVFRSLSHITDPYHRRDGQQEKAIVIRPSIDYRTFLLIGLSHMMSE